jgi:hypothetical protein
LSSGRKLYIFNRQILHLCLILIVTLAGVPENFFMASR